MDPQQLVNPLFSMMFATQRSILEAQMATFQKLNELQQSYADILRQFGKEIRPQG